MHAICVLNLGISQTCMRELNWGHSGNPDIPSCTFPVSVRLQTSDIMRGSTLCLPVLSQTHPYLEVRGRESQMMTQRLLLPRGTLSTSGLLVSVCTCLCMYVCTCVCETSLSLRGSFYSLRGDKQSSCVW